MSNNGNEHLAKRREELVKELQIAQQNAVSWGQKEHQLRGAILMCDELMALATAEEPKPEGEAK
jgi:hypothetical protein